MKKLCKRIISGAFAFVTLFLVCLPRAYALPSIEVDVDVVDFFQWVYGELDNTKNTIWGYVWNKVDDDVCPSAPSVGGRHNFVERRTQVDGKTGLYYICEYCGRSAGEVGEEVYQKQVSELPATGINSAGRLIWQPVLTDCVYDSSYFRLVSFDKNIYFSSFPYSDARGSVGFLSSGRGVFHKTSYSLFDSFLFSFQVPIDGLYARVANELMAYGTFVDRNGISGSKSYFTSGSTFSHYSFGSELSYSTNFNFTFGVEYVSYGSAEYYFPTYEVIPDTAIDTSAGGKYSITNRPTAITGGNYGIVGDGGTINTVTNNKPIINEITNIFYNPATGQEYPIGDWTYNYENRTYTITLDTGDTVNVEYGDENINITETTIIEGDTIVNNYTIYYMIDGTGGDSPNPSPAPAPCAHSWQESARTDPTCTFPGRAVYTCSKCGETKTETLSATGHTWQVERTVQTVYDENGDIIQQGYTIYQCASCGEQYKDMDSTGPPPPGGDVDDGGLAEWLNGLIKSLSDNLSGAVELILRFFTEIPKLFGGFLDFLSAMFPFLPDEIMLLLTFGIAALVFVGIIKAIRR